MKRRPNTLDLLPEQSLEAGQGPAPEGVLWGPSESLPVISVGFRVGWQPVSPAQKGSRTPRTSGPCPDNHSLLPPPSSYGSLASLAQRVGGALLPVPSNLRTQPPRVLWNLFLPAKELCRKEGKQAHSIETTALREWWSRGCTVHSVGPAGV